MYSTYVYIWNVQAALLHNKCLKGHQICTSYQRCILCVLVDMVHMNYRD